MHLNFKFHVKDIMEYNVNLSEKICLSVKIKNNLF